MKTDIKSTPDKQVREQLREQLRSQIRGQLK
jgi:hypothetical protein